MRAGFLSIYEIYSYRNKMCVPFNLVRYSDRDNRNYQSVYVDVPIRELGVVDIFTSSIKVGDRILVQVEVPKPLFVVVKCNGLRLGEAQWTNGAYLVTSKFEIELGDVQFYCFGCARFHLLSQDCDALEYADDPKMLITKYSVKMSRYDFLTVSDYHYNGWLEVNYWVKPGSRVKIVFIDGVYFVRVKEMRYFNVDTKPPEINYDFNGLKRFIYIECET